MFNRCFFTARRNSDLLDPFLFTNFRQNASPRRGAQKKHIQKKKARRQWRRQPGSSSKPDKPIANEKGQNKRPNVLHSIRPVWFGATGKTCKERDNAYACCFIIVYFVSRRNSDCSDTQTRFSLKVKVRNRVTATRRAKKTYTKEESAPSSTATAGQQLRIG